MQKQQYDNNMRGALFNNDKKETEKHPDYKGSCEIDGVEFWMSGWIKESKKDGSKYLSVAFTRKDDDDNGRPANKPQYNAPRNNNRPF